MLLHARPLGCETVAFEVNQPEIPRGGETETFDPPTDIRVKGEDHVGAVLIEPRSKSGLRVVLDSGGIVRGHALVGG